MIRYTYIATDGTEISCKTEEPRISWRAIRNLKFRSGKSEEIRNLNRQLDALCRAAHICTVCGSEMNPAEAGPGYGDPRHFGCMGEPSGC